MARVCMSGYDALAKTAGEVGIGYLAAGSAAEFCQASVKGMKQIRSDPQRVIVAVAVIGITANQDGVGSS